MREPMSKTNAEVFCLGDVFVTFNKTWHRELGGEETVAVTKGGGTVAPATQEWLEIADMLEDSAE